MMPGLLTALLAGLMLGLSQAAAPAAGAVHTPPIKPVGVLLHGNTHFCTGSVLQSPGHDLVMTAAHCVTGNGTGISFAPEYGGSSGRMPYGRWQVTAAFVDPRWKSHGDPAADFAILRVASRVIGGHRHNIEDLTGGNRLAINRPYRAWVRVTGYDGGDLTHNNSPLTCSAWTRYFAPNQRELDCGPLAGGTSGSPYVMSYNPGHQTGDLIGVLGGYKQGGCSAAVSYAAQFDQSTEHLYQRATRSAHGDSGIRGFPSGC
jgi:V8-like Glu-specific endopeptidase